MYLRDNGYGNVRNIHGVRNLLYMAPQQSLLPEEHHGTTWVADRAIDFVRTNDGRHPWMLKLGIIAPHPPFNVPPGYEDLYNNADFPEALSSTTATSPASEENRLLGDIPTKSMGRRMREAYYSMISHVDRQVGRILDVLDETGLSDNTLVIFTSDHGELLGDYDLYQKWLPYDSCARIPMILKWPGKISSGTRNDDFVDLADLYPTMLSAAGVSDPQPEELQGEDLLSGVGNKNRSEQFVEYSRGSRRWISIRTKEWKYNWYFGGGFEELFDLRADPGETNNLCESEPDAHAVMKERLRDRLTVSEKKWGMPDSVVDDDLVTMEADEVHSYRNRAFPVFQEKLTDEKERLLMNPFLDEVAAVVSREPTVSLRSLDLESWKRNGGFDDQVIDDWLDQVER